MINEMVTKGLSAREACQWAGVSRAVATYALKRPAQDQVRLTTMRRVARRNPRYGYRRVAVVSQLGFGQTWRLWKQHDFKLAPQRRRPKRQPTTGPNRPCQADHPQHVWTYDILHDRLADGQPFKVLSVLDEFTRECVAILVAFSIRAEDVIALLRKVFRHRGAPEFLRSDNGSEFTAEAVQAWLEAHHAGPAFIAPGHPWENGFIESYHDKLRDECLDREWFESLAEARVVIEKWRRHYNTRRPHSALRYQTPAQFAAAYKTKR
jgi:transposase InsO family protein